MAGTRAGGKKAAATIKKTFGEDFYRELGRKENVAKGFASEKVDKNGMTGYDRAKIYGSIAGQISSRKRVLGGKKSEMAKDNA